MIVLPRRKCGVPRPGLYAVGARAPRGTLNAFTAIAAPVEAYIANPRAAEKVHIHASLSAGYGLIPPGPGLGSEPFAQLPIWGMADLWGKSAGYKTVWDVIEETVAKGVARRIPKVPDVTLPCPLLMLHMNTFASPRMTTNTDTLRELLPEFFSGSPPNALFLFDQPWRDAKSLGRSGDDTFMSHPHVRFWQVIGQIDTRKRNKTLKELDVRLTEGIFGFTWITAFCQVLKPHEDRVHDNLAQVGVLPALAPNDPRALQMSQEAMEI